MYKELSGVSRLGRACDPARKRSGRTFAHGVRISSATGQDLWIKTVYRARSISGKHLRRISSARTSCLAFRRHRFASITVRSAEYDKAFLRPALGSFFFFREAFGYQVRVRDFARRLGAP